MAQCRGGAGGAQPDRRDYVAPTPDPITRLSAVLDGRYCIERELGVLKLRSGRKAEYGKALSQFPKRGPTDDTPE